MYKRGKKQYFLSTKVTYSQYKMLKTYKKKQRLHVYLVYKKGLFILHLPSIYSTTLRRWQVPAIKPNNCYLYFTINFLNGTLSVIHLLLSRHKCPFQDLRMIKRPIKHRKFVRGIS